MNRDKRNSSLLIKDKKVQEDIRKLVVARIRTFSEDFRVSIGGVAKGYSKEELVRSVEKNDKIGKEVTAIQMEYLKDMAQGKIYSFDGNSHNKTKL
ncbi:hypothetical protein COT44_01200 [Candidatus Shapirobacteria bacterium CG08_land_8_20_14_0_20_39_18]|uniref:Uncharacterized protein n=1 Tax=Candidatus Shapirobacteria bacterium CG08_land_8_20_14_0_20_39_18 TaxID=1974883 RepID=A0A2M6XDX1_9BACT|nr:MAG: hypothetical protein COT44_01200 [Candidatus Shapirobacteria bacterium CG08_land_8_20_14_0_20_39_18]